MQILKKNLKYFFVGLLAAGAVFVWYVVFCESRSGLEVDFLDIGQGDAEFVQTGNGNQVLIDGGPNKSILYQLSKVMPFYDRSIDVLILSHAHSDHISGLIEVLKRYKVNLVVEPCLKVETSEYKEWLRLIEDKKIKKICAQRGQRMCLGDGSCFNILLPQGEVKGRKIHDAMLVAKLTYGKNSFLFTGDMERNLESYLVYTEGKGLKSNILKVGHHGSDTSTSESFLGRVSPEYAVISVGEGNKFGHPHKEILDRLEQFGVSIFRTDKLGTIKTKSDGEFITIAR